MKRSGSPACAKLIVHQHGSPTVKWFRMTTTTPENETPSPRTKDEQEILEVVARVEGWDYVNRHAESILDRARAFGDL